MRTFAGAKAELTPIDIQKAWGAWLDDLEAATLSNAQFREAANPGFVPGDLLDLGPLTGSQHVQRHQHLNLGPILIEISSQIVSSEQQDASSLEVENRGKTVIEMGV